MYLLAGVFVNRKLAFSYFGCRTGDIFGDAFRRLDSIEVRIADGAVVALPLLILCF